MELFEYGMKSRGVAPGAQPSDIYDWKEIEGDKYHSRVIYLRKLKDSEVDNYDLEFIKSEHNPNV